MTDYIYSLVNPSNGEEFYVGWTTDPAYRLRTHIRMGSMRSDMSPKGVYMRNLRDRGIRPYMKILEEGHMNNPREREAYWTHQKLIAGKRLMNTHTHCGDSSQVWITRPAAAKLLGISSTTITTWAKQVKIRYRMEHCYMHIAYNSLPLERYGIKDKPE